MTEITLAAAQTIVTVALETARSAKMNPLGIVVLDARAAMKAYAAEDHVSLKRADIAIAKAHGALAMGMGSRGLAKRAKEMPHFINAASHIVGGMLMPVPGGVLVRDADGRIIGAVGVSGDTSDNDELAAKAGIAAAGFTADGDQGTLSPGITLRMKHFIPIPEPGNVEVGALLSGDIVDCRAVRLHRYFGGHRRHRPHLVLHRDRRLRDFPGHRPDGRQRDPMIQA